MKRLKGIIMLLFLFVFCCTLSAFADDTMKTNVQKKYKETKDICNTVKSLLSEGMNTKEVTKACIELGHDACLVVRCAIDANGTLEQIITGALEAGVTSDVCSRCAIEAGVDPEVLAKAFETGLGYTPPLGAGLTPIEIGIPGSTPGGGYISSSGF